MSNGREDGMIQKSFRVHPISWFIGQDMILQSLKSFRAPDLDPFVGSINHTIIDWKPCPSRNAYKILIVVVFSSSRRPRSIVNVKGRHIHDIVAQHGHLAVVFVQSRGTTFHFLPYRINTMPLLDNVVNARGIDKGFGHPWKVQIFTILCFGRSILFHQLASFVRKFRFIVTDNGDRRLLWITVIDVLDCLSHLLDRLHVNLATTSGSDILLFFFHIIVMKVNVASILLVGLENVLNNGR
mmetsp:Transcript_628/g.1087  ORF Transcript_628/g.1087 Transcript_628/m.1087 type:complete len:240 (-) Transcript_628:265-984(-)